MAFILLMGGVVQVYASDTLALRVKRNSDWAFYGTDSPTVKVALVNGKQVERDFNFLCRISDSAGKPLYELQQEGKVPPLDSSLLSFSFKAISPGFYNVGFCNNGKVVGGMNIAYEPEKIAVGNDSIAGDKGDFRSIAYKVALERRELKPQFSLLHNRNLSGREKNVYSFSMVSRGDCRVLGYAAFPKGKKLVPMLVTLVAEDERAGNPLADFTAPAGCAELVVYIAGRGRGEEKVLNMLTDMVLALDFAAQRAEIDKSAIFIQGAGSTASCAFVSSALSESIAGAFACSPDFSFFTGRYTLTSVGKNVSAPVLLGTGLQRDIVSLQECFSIFNAVTGVKEYFVDPSGSGIGRKQWRHMRDMFMLRLKD